MKKEPGFGLKTWLGERVSLPDIVVVSISHTLRLRPSASDLYHISPSILVPVFKKKKGAKEKK